jgi:hypothetical protein
MSVHMVEPASEKGSEPRLSLQPFLPGFAGCRLWFPPRRIWFRYLFSAGNQAPICSGAVRRLTLAVWGFQTQRSVSARVHMKEKQLYSAQKRALPSGCIYEPNRAGRIFRHDFNAVIVRIEALTID